MNRRWQAPGGRVPDSRESKSATTSWVRRQAGGRKEGADRNADHVVDPFVARRLAGIEEERL